MFKLALKKNKKKIHILSFFSLDHRTQLLTNVLKMIQRAIFKTFCGLCLHARLFPNDQFAFASGLPSLTKQPN